MVTLAEEPENNEPKAVERTVRSAIAGHPQGAVRRIVLYLIAFGLVISPLPVIAVIPLTLLAVTDQLA